MRRSRQAFRSAGFIQGGPRLITIVPTTSGNVAFYESTGTGSGRHTEDMWLPFGGIAERTTSTGVLTPWFVKLPSSHPQAANSKFPKEGSEFFQIGLTLAKLHKSNPFNEIRWYDWIQQQGYPSYQAVEDLTGNYIPDDPRYRKDFLFRQEYGMIATNYYLNKSKALKPEWAKGKAFYGSQKNTPSSPNDPQIEGWTLLKLRNLLKSQNLRENPEKYLLFSYGSNHTKQLSDRIGRNIEGTPAYLEGWKLLFAGVSRNWGGRGVAIIIQTDDEEDEVCGYVTEVTERELDKLDVHEGVAYDCYLQAYVTAMVQTDGGKFRDQEAVAYLPGPRRQTLNAPSRKYISAVKKTITEYWSGGGCLERLRQAVKESG